MCQGSCERSDNMETTGSPRVASFPVGIGRYGVSSSTCWEHYWYAGPTVFERSQHVDISQRLEGDGEGAVSEA